MKSYSPYDNVKPQAYPNMYISTGLHDSQVQYWELQMGLSYELWKQIILFLDTNMDAGHGGASGRFEAIKELAKNLVFY
jgi:oligopeptidase B